MPHHKPTECGPHVKRSYGSVQTVKSGYNPETPLHFPTNAMTNRTGPPTANKVGLVSLGCPKALVDSERILTQLTNEGYEIVPTYDEADLVIVNTCGFIDAAKAESLETIGEALDENGKVIVTGCLGAKRREIDVRFPQLLGITGPNAYAQVMQMVHNHLPPVQDYNPYTDLIPPQGVKLTPPHYAYIKISEGCNHRCTFCIIPSMRGDLVSRPAGDVLQEAERLVEAGVKELLIVSQDTSAYGVDVKYRTSFWGGRPLKTRMFDLCEALGSLGVWIRLHYVYPYPHVDRIIPLMAEGRILPYLDIPFQHASQRILKLMRRPAAAEKTLERINTWRDICPDICIRSTFIVGFPGETDQDFNELIDFLEAAQLDRVGCFKYSPVDGAKANELSGAVPEDIKEERYELFMQTQQHISEERLKKKIGQSIDILVDEVEEHVAIGRSFADAPEIDGNVFVDTTEVEPGDLVTGTVQRSDAHDLWATVAPS